MELVFVWKCGCFICLLSSLALVDTCTLRVELGWDDRLDVLNERR